MSSKDEIAEVELGKELGNGGMKDRLVNVTAYDEIVAEK